jgi:hypothetical protein
MAKFKGKLTFEKFVAPASRPSVLNYDELLAGCETAGTRRELDHELGHET